MRQSRSSRRPSCSPSTSSRIKAHNAEHLSFSTTMRLSASLYISFDTVRSDFLSAKARLPESPALTNTFTKLPRLAGIFQPLYTFFLRLYRGIMFCLLAFNLLGKWGFDTDRRAIRLYMNTFCSEPDGILAQNQLQMPWTRRALPSLSTAF